MKRGTHLLGHAAQCFWQDFLKMIYLFSLSWKILELIFKIFLRWKKAREKSTEKNSCNFFSQNFRILIGRSWAFLSAVPAYSLPLD